MKCSILGINYWLKSRLLEAIPPGERAEFWLGGRAEVTSISQEYLETFFTATSPHHPPPGTAQRAPARHLDVGQYERDHHLVRLD